MSSHTIVWLWISVMMLWFLKSEITPIAEHQTVNKIFCWYSFSFRMCQTQTTVTIVYHCHKGSISRQKSLFIRTPFLAFLNKDNFLKIVRYCWEVLWRSLKKIRRAYSFFSISRLAIYKYFKPNSTRHWYKINKDDTIIIITD